MVKTSDGALVTVVITCFNYGRYLAQSVESALGQTYSNVEVIVVNDGSTDDTQTVASRYLSDPRFVYIEQGNRGQAAAKNVGVCKARGDAIAFLDADDVWCPDKLERQVPCLRQPEVGVVYCRAWYLDEESRGIDYEMNGSYLQPRRGRVTEWLLFDNFVQFSSTLVRKECFKRFGVFNEELKMGIDWDLWLRISTGYLFEFVDEPLFYYRMGHTGQMSKNLEERHRCSDRIMSDFLSRHRHLLPLQTIRRAHAYTCCCRGEYFSTIDRHRSIRYYLEAMMNNPAESASYKGIVKILLQMTQGRSV